MSPSPNWGLPSKAILSVKSLSMAGMPGPQSQASEQLLSRFLRGVAVWEATRSRGLSPLSTQGTSSLTEGENNIPTTE